MDKIIIIIPTFCHILVISWTTPGVIVPTTTRKIDVVANKLIDNCSLKLPKM